MGTLRKNMDIIEHLLFYYIISLFYTFNIFDVSIF